MGNLNKPLIILTVFCAVFLGSTIGLRTYTEYQNRTSYKQSDKLAFLQDCKSAGYSEDLCSCIKNRITNEIPFNVFFKDYNKYLSTGTWQEREVNQVLICEE